MANIETRKMSYSEEYVGSFEYLYVICSEKDLENVLGAPTYRNHRTTTEKVQVYWTIEIKDTDNGNKYKVQVYDYGEYRHYSRDSKIEFHIGGEDNIGDRTGALLFVEYLKKELEEISADVRIVDQKKKLESMFNN